MKNTLDPTNLHDTFSKNNLSSRPNGFKQDGSNSNHKGSVTENNHNFVPQNTFSPNQTLSKQTPQNRSLLIPNIIFALLFAIIIFAFFYLIYFATVPPKSDISNIKSISILPFKHIGDGKDDRLELGLADTLISRLSNQDKIKISPTATVAKFLAGDADNLIEIGEQLEVDAILTGTIQRENNAVRVNIQ